MLPGGLSRVWNRSLFFERIGLVHKLGLSLHGQLTHIACLPFACLARALLRGFSPSLLLSLLLVAGIQKLESPWAVFFSYSFVALIRNKRHTGLCFTCRRRFLVAFYFKLLGKITKGVCKILGFFCCVDHIWVALVRNEFSDLSYKDGIRGCHRVFKLHFPVRKLVFYH